MLPMEGTRDFFKRYGGVVGRLIYLTYCWQLLGSYRFWPLTFSALIVYKVIIVNPL